MPHVLQLRIHRYAPTMRVLNLKKVFGGGGGGADDGGGDGDEEGKLP